MFQHSSGLVPVSFDILDTYSDASLCRISPYLSWSLWIYYFSYGLLLLLLLLVTYGASSFNSLCGIISILLSIIVMPISSTLPSINCLAWQRLLFNNNKIARNMFNNIHGKSHKLQEILLKWKHTIVLTTKLQKWYVWNIIQSVFLVQNPIMFPLCFQLYMFYPLFSLPPLWISRWHKLS